MATFVLTDSFLIADPGNNNTYIFTIQPLENFQGKVIAICNELGIIEHSLEHLSITDPENNPIPIQPGEVFGKFAVVNAMDMVEFKGELETQAISRWL